MKQIFRAALIGSLLFMLLCIGAMLIGQSHPTQIDLFNYLGKCGNQPCYLGVVPGLTPLNAAIATFEDIPGMEFDPDTNIASNPPGFHGSTLIFTWSPDDPIIGGIALNPTSPSINIGSLVELFGSPCLVNDTPNTETVIYFPNLVVSGWMKQHNADRLLYPTIPVQRITLVNGVRLCDYWALNIVTARPWHGFGRYTN